MGLLTQFSASFGWLSVTIFLFIAVGLNEGLGCKMRLTVAVGNDFYHQLYGL